VKNAFAEALANSDEESPTLTAGLGFVEWNLKLFFAMHGYLVDRTVFMRLFLSCGI